MFGRSKEKPCSCADSQSKPSAPARSPVRRTVMIICACIFLICAAWLIKNVVDYYRGDKLYGELADKIFEADFEDDVGKLDAMKKNVAGLKAAYPDVYGYIHVDGTRISFPIVKGEDNEYYLKRAYNGQFMVCGAIFADFESADKLENNRNTVLYGHNMLDGNMFNNVMLFLEEDVFNSKLIEIYTEEGIYTYEPFAVFKTRYDYPYFTMEFESDDDFVAFCEEMQNNSLYSKDMTFTSEDKIITLSTCTPSTDVEWYGVGRYALHAKLIKVEK